MFLCWWAWGAVCTWLESSELKMRRQWPVSLLDRSSSFRTSTSYEQTSGLCVGYRILASSNSLSHNHHWYNFSFSIGQNEIPNHASFKNCSIAFAFVAVFWACAKQTRHYTPLIRIVYRVLLLFQWEWRPEDPPKMWSPKHFRRAVSWATALRNSARRSYKKLISVQHNPNIEHRTFSEQAAPTCTILKTWSTF